MKKLLLIFILLVSLNSVAQNIPTNRPSRIDSFINSKVGKQIQINNNLKTEQDELINFPNTDKDAFLYFGFYGCIPCMKELPLYYKLSTLFPEVNFIYITFNSRQYREKEFKEILGEEYKLPGNFKIVELSRSQIDELDLIAGYPTRIFIKKGGIVNSYGFGGSELDKESERKDWIVKHSEIIKFEYPDK